MRHPTEMELFDAIDTTWAPFAFHTHQGWLIREGKGGGKRVSAATALPKTSTAKINSAVTMMQALGQDPLFMIRGSDIQLDQELETAGYSIIDPVVVLAAPTDSLALETPTNTCAIQQLPSPNETAKAIWENGGIGSARLDIMARVQSPKSIWLRAIWALHLRQHIME